MTADQIELVKKSFDGLWPVRRKLAELFYSRFFELAPESRRLFPDSMEKQNLKLMDALAAMVGALDRREIFQSVISHSARGLITSAGCLNCPCRTPRTTSQGADQVQSAIVLSAGIPQLYNRSRDDKCVLDSRFAEDDDWCSASPGIRDSGCAKRPVEGGRYEQIQGPPRCK